MWIIAAVTAIGWCATCWAVFATLDRASRPRHGAGCPCSRCLP